MSLDHQIYGSSDWHLPSPSSTPKSAAGPNSTLKTPRTELFPQSHFLDAWSTPRVHGHQTPVQTPTFNISTPIDRPSTAHTQKVQSPEDPEFHVNHFAVTNLPLPPVDPSRRLSSSPVPPSVNQSSQQPPQSQQSSMDTSQMQTPPPTRDATSRRFQQGSGNGTSTPATVIARTPLPSEGLFNHTPFGFPSLQFSPDMLQFSSTGPMTAPVLPHSRLLWDQPNDVSQMDVDMPLASDPFGNTPHKIDSNVDWSTFPSPAANTQMSSRALQGAPSPRPGSSFSYATSNAGDAPSPRSSFISPSGGVDPSMLFSFSTPGPATSFSTIVPSPTKQAQTRQPYETQLNDALREKEAVRKAKSSHSRTSTSSSAASFDSRPSLQRSNTDSGFRKSRPSSMESRSSGSTAVHHIPRRSSPLKRTSGASLMAIPEVRRPKTRLVIDESGRARTETVPFEDDEEQIVREARRNAQDLKQQYPGLWADDDSDSETDEAPPTVTLSRNTSFNIPQRRSSKHARNESNELHRSNSFKMARPISRPSSGVFDKTSFESIRPVRRVADNAHRRFSMMDLPTSFVDLNETVDEAIPDPPGNALGALKKAVEGRQQRIDRSVQNSLQAHNQRWAQASADLSQGQSMAFDPFSTGFSVSPANTTDTALTTPSTDRSSMSGESARCVCNGSDDGRPMILCDSCKKWLHMSCVGLNQSNMPPVYVCIFCTGQTPIARGNRIRGPMPAPFDSPLTHKSIYRR